MSCSGKNGKCMRPGRLTSNGYLNYLREFRKKHCGLSAIETVKKGAKRWNCLSEASKAKYRRMGCNATMRRPTKRRGCGSKRKRRGCRPKRSGCKKRKSRCGNRRVRRRRSKCGAAKGKCMRPGPVTSNPYFNFMRSFRRKNCGLTPKQSAKKGARKWCSMPAKCKSRYYKQACRNSKSPRKRCSKFCREALKRKRKKTC